MNPHYNNYNNSNKNIYNDDTQDEINDGSNNITWNNSVDPAYYSFPTFANTNNNNLNMGYMNDMNINNPVSQNAKASDSSAVNRINAFMSHSSSQYLKDDSYNQSNNQISSSAASSSFYSNMKNSKSINNFNNYINNKVSTIKNFTKKNILQIHNCINPIPNFSTSSSNVNIENVDDDSTSLLNNDGMPNDEISNSENGEIADITIIPTTEVYTSNNNATTSNTPENTIHDNTNKIIENNYPVNENPYPDINRQKPKKHILKRNALSESLTNIQNTLFNSDHYLPEYDFLIELLSIPNDNLVIKHAIQHRISYLQEYIDETRRYTQLSIGSKLKKSILIQAVTLVLTLIVLFNTSFFIDDSNQNLFIERKVYLLKLLGIILLFYNELIFIQNSLLSVHSIAIGNIDIIFGNHNNNRSYSFNNNQNSITNINNSVDYLSNYIQKKGNHSITSPLNTTLHDKYDYGSMENSNSNIIFNNNHHNNKMGVFYSATLDKLQKRMSEKDYYTQEKAFYTRNNINVEKLDYSMLSINEDSMNALPNSSPNNNKQSEFNSFPSFKNNIDNPLNIKKSINNYTTKRNITPPNESDIIIKNKKNMDDILYDSNIENTDHLTSIPNNRINNYISVNVSNEYSPTRIPNNRSNSNQDAIENQMNDSDDGNPSSIRKMYRKVMDYLYNSYNAFWNLSSVNRFMNNKNNYYEEIKKTLFIAISQGMIWGSLFSFIGFFYSNDQIIYSILILFSFIISSVIMSLISSINPVMVKITQISDPIFVVGPLEVLIQVYLSIITYKIGMYIL